MGFRAVYTVGEQVGHLFYVRDAEDYISPCGSYKRRRCVFKCRCGNEFVAVDANARSKNTRGCGQCSFSKPTRKEPGEAARYELYGTYQNNAKRAVKPKEFALSYEDFKTLTAANCVYCGATPANQYRWADKARSRTGGCIYNGIDRQDPDKGYVQGNCVTCCWACNNAKAQMTVDEFLAWVDRVQQHQRHLHGPSQERV